MAASLQVIGQILDLLQQQTASGSLTWEDYGNKGFRAVFGNQVVFVEVDPFSGPTFEVRNNRGELVQKVASPTAVELIALASAAQTITGKPPPNLSTDAALLLKVRKLLDTITNFDANRTKKALEELLANLKQRSDKQP